MSSDEEFKIALEKAVRQYKRNKKKDDSSDIKSSTSKKKAVQKKENIIAKKIMENTISMDLSNCINPNNDSKNSFSDIEELVNYFFSPTNIEKPKSMSDFVKQGAIPKPKFKTDSGDKKIKFTSENLKAGREPKKQHMDTQKRSLQKFSRDNQSTWKSGKRANNEDTSKRHWESSDKYDFLKLNKEICSKPFYYVVPENPSPKLIFSRGSYYVIPKVPTSLRGNNITIIHPEREAPLKNEKKKKSETIEKIEILENLEQENSIDNPQEPLNNLGKNIPPKIDCHLNIGPMDVRYSEYLNNLETNGVYDKNYDKHLTPEESVGNGASLEKLKKNVDDFAKKWVLEIPDEENDDLLDETFPEEYSSNEKWSLKMLDQLQENFQTAAENLSDSEYTSIEFQGNEELLETYTKTKPLENKKFQWFLYMQSILPDADPDFLRQKIDSFGDKDDAIESFANRLLETQDFPRISQDPLSAERKRLWNSYVKNFTVKNFLLKVRNPEEFTGESGNHANHDLSLKFLMSRYPNESSEDLSALLLHNNNIVETVQNLNGIQPIRLAESSFQEEAFDEAFLKQVCYIDHREEILDYLKELRERREIEAEDARLNNCFLSCPLCAENELVPSEVVTCPEGDVFCKSCIERFAFVKIGDGVFKVPCPQENCKGFFTSVVLENLLPENVFKHLIKKQQAEEIGAAQLDDIEFCPHCDFAYIPNPEDKIFKCQNPDCMIETCRNCKEKSHIPLRCEEVERPADLQARKKIEEAMTEELVRICPQCKKKFIKIDGCNKIVCTCGAIICYLCRNIVSGYDHFLSSRCSKFSPNDYLHRTSVLNTGIRTRDQILQENPHIRIMADPTVDKDFNIQ